jgi:hypothetical protein
VRSEIEGGKELYILTETRERGTSVLESRCAWGTGGAMLETPARVAPFIHLLKYKSPRITLQIIQTALVARTDSRLHPFPSAGVGPLSANRIHQPFIPPISRGGRVRDHQLLLIPTYLAARPRSRDETDCA